MDCFTSGFIGDCLLHQKRERVIMLWFIVAVVGQVVVKLVADAVTKD
jgi:hypothetical protein